MCLWCGTDIAKKYTPRTKNVNTCGNKKGCRPAYTQWRVEREIQFSKEVKAGMKQHKHKRKCRVCGKPCWPNYFYCKTHHAAVTRRDPANVLQGGRTL